MIPPVFRSIVIIALVLTSVGTALTTPLPASAQSTAVVIQNFSFMPAITTVSVGTIVTWTNRDSTPHTSTSDTGIWNSGVINPGSSFQYRFMVPGTFTYHCMIHPFMHGTIVVQGSGMPPPVTSTPMLSAANTVLVGTTTTIQGSGFTPNSQAFVFWHRPDGTSRGVFLMTSPGGTFALLLGFLPRHGIGTEIVAATDQATRMTTSAQSIAVVPRGVGPGLLTASINPVIRGGFTMIIGQRFSPGSVVVVQWRRPDGTMGVVRVRSDGLGRFAFQLLADPRHGCGIRTFTALDASTLLVNGPGSMILSEIC